ncbi:MAG: preprotein translocase subunit SecG [Bacillota bacterium]|nr:preprotein translocase subunit SecG [Bacillota bacterium]
MSILSIVVNIFHILFAVSLIVIVLLQSGKQAGLSGAIAGGAETFFGKNKGRTIDALLSKYTTVAAIFFIITSIALELLINK